MGFSSENIEKRCPKCGAERELQSVILALPGYIDRKRQRKYTGCLGDPRCSLFKGTFEVGENPASPGAG